MSHLLDYQIVSYHRSEEMNRIGQEIGKPTLEQVSSRTDPSAARGFSECLTTRSSSRWRMQARLSGPIRRDLQFGLLGSARFIAKRCVGRPLSRSVSQCKELVKEVPALFSECRRLLKGANSSDLVVNLGNATKSKIPLSTVSAGLRDLSPHPAEDAKDVQALQDPLR